MAVTASSIHRFHLNGSMTARRPFEPESATVDRDRLVSFNELLERRTARPPLDLPRFYAFLQREGAEDVLDFWLDVDQHETLCRTYFEGLRSSGRSIRSEWPEYWDYARRRGSIYGSVVLSSSATSSRDQPGIRSPTARVPPITRRSGRLASLKPPSIVVPPSIAPSSDPLETSKAPPPPPPAAPREIVEAALRRAARAPGDPGISRDRLVASAREIYERYLMPGAEKEVYLPPALRITSFPHGAFNYATPDSVADEIETLSGDVTPSEIPDMFHPQKNYIFRAMEQDAYPRFLRALAFGNILPVTALLRMLIGSFVLWVGLSIGLSLIFLDVRPKSRRFFVFIPFFIAIMLFISHQYQLDPVLALLGKTETRPFHTRPVREPYVRKLLTGRGIWVIILISLLSTALTMIFWAVPGHRL